MIATEDIELVEETVHQLRTQGDDRRARALESVLAAARPGEVKQRIEDNGTYWPLRMAGRAVGGDSQIIKKAIARGELPAIIRDGTTLIHDADLCSFLERWGQSGVPSPTHPPDPPEVVEARVREYEEMMARLPADKVARHEELNDKMQDGHRLNREERAEFNKLAKELAIAATVLLKEKIERGDFARPERRYPSGANQ